MAQLGADVEELDRLARKFDEEAQQISQATQQISSQVQSTWWKGADAERFKSEWNGNYASQLRKMAEALKQIDSVPSSERPCYVVIAISPDGQTSNESELACVP